MRGTLAYTTREEQDEPALLIKVDVRKIINMSLPIKTTHHSKQEAKMKDHISPSKHQEKDLLLVLRASQVEIRMGKGKKLHSLKDLR